MVQTGLNQTQNPLGLWLPSDGITGASHHVQFLCSLNLIPETYVKVEGVVSPVSTSVPWHVRPHYTS